ncbi:MAG: SDR family NAD(P)-dependent oxidoreductase [Steroidobacteraceae bacterium]
MKRIAVITAALWFAAIAQGMEPAAGTPRKAVLVTGASTGIGHKITERLAANGYFVYAGARKDKDLEALGRLANVEPLRLDVTSAADIAAAVDTITKAGRGLQGLVNNAGIATFGPFDQTAEADFDLVMKVNVYGPWRVTKAFTPLLVASKGRITTIGSISGILSTKDLGVYSMTKHAIEAYTDSLAAQMAPRGVGVSVIEPGNYNSEIGRNAARRLGMDSRLSDRSQYKDPDDVAAAVEHALFSPAPKRRYMVVPSRREAEVTIRKAIEELVQLNQDQPFSYGRDALVKMLDDALAAP